MNSSTPTVATRRVSKGAAACQYFRQSGVILGANLLAAMSSYLIHPVLGHLLGLDAYGTVISLLSLLSILLIPTQIVATAVSRQTSALYVTHQHAQLNDLIRRLTFVFIPLGLGISAILGVFSSQIASFLNLQSSQQVLIIAVVFVLAFVTAVNGGVLQGLQKFYWLAFVSTVPLIVRLILVITFLALGWGINGAVLGFVLTPILDYFISLIPLVSILKGARRPIPSLRPLWSSSATAAIALASTVFLVNSDTILAKHFLPTHEAGQYAALGSLGNMVLFMSGSVVTVMFPKVVALYESGQRTTHVMMQALLGVLALSACIESVYWLAPTTIVRLLFGSAFMAVAGHLAWYGLAMLFLALAQALLIYFLSVGSRVFILSATLSCGLQIALILVRHKSIEQFVQAVVIADSLLLSMLLIAWLISSTNHKTTIITSTSKLSRLSPPPLFESTWQSTKE